MSNVEMSGEALEAAGRELAGKGAVQMVNLIKYRADATYVDPSTLPPCSGREAYFGRYVPAFADVAARVAPGETFSPVFIGNVVATIVAAPGEAWDDIAIVEYASFEALRKIITSPDYEAHAAPHRRAALADWRFIAALKAQLPG